MTSETVIRPEPATSPSSRSDAPACRLCGEVLAHVVVDLGSTPLCESFLSAERLQAMEPCYPLTVFVCHRCYLVQLPAHVRGEEIFSDYAYFSSYSDSWLAHARRYVDALTGRLGLTPESQVVEVGSNDGYLLQYFAHNGIPVLGIDPAANVAQVARDRGVPTRVAFFGEGVAQDLAREGVSAQLLLGNNVLAQVPDLHDFVAGLATLLAPGGVLTLEFPHLMRLVEENQFDTIYHEHYSYFSYLSAERVLAAHGLIVFDVEELPTHGGSLRLYARHEGEPSPDISERARALRERERAAGVETLGYYADFAERVREVKRQLLEFLIGAKRAGKQVVGYGAPGKGNTLLNYCGIRTDFLDYTVDRNPHKQGMFLPGSRIPILAPERIDETEPDYVLILPWNLREEIMAQLGHIRRWGARFVVPIPGLRIYE